MGTSALAKSLAVSERQDGVVLRQQLYDAGLSRATLLRRIQAGLWIPHGRKVLTLRGTPDSLATRSRVAGLRVPAAILTGPSAAALLGGGPWQGIDLPSTPWLIADKAPSGVLRLVHPGVRWLTVGMCRVAEPVDAVVDLLRFLPMPESRTLVYRAMQTKLLTLDLLRDRYEALNGCTGVPQLGSILADVSSGVHSEAERLAVEILRESSLSGWHANFPVRLPGGWVEIDIAFPDVMVAVEIDGRAWHSGAHRFRQDRRRGNRISQAGWYLLRFTWDDLVEEPDRFVREIVQGIHRPSRRNGG